MELYAAPMEGLTNSIWRKAFRQVFGGADAYFSPFLSPNANYSFQTKEEREVGGKEKNLIPQMVANRPEYFTWACEEMLKLGYHEVNLNLGCPSGTLVAKRKGAGMLTDTKELDAFLEGIFKMIPREVSVSVKTRIGRYSEEEWEKIMRVYNRYPLSRLIIHPRVQKEFYNGEIHWNCFDYAVENAQMPLVYNGDLVSISQISDFARKYPGIPVMIGRGLLKDPSLFRQVRGGEAASREELRRYHDELIAQYRLAGFDDLSIVHRTKEMWAYLSASFEDTESALKKIRKAKKMDEYLSGANEILDHCHLAK